MRTQDAWGWKIAAYLFVSGTGAGAYAIGSACRLLGDEWRAATNVALVLGPLLVGPATLFLIWDLGRPSGFMRAGRRPRSSWISRGVAIITAFLVVSVAHVVLGVWPLSLVDRGVLLSLVGVGLAVLTMVYTGLLLGAVRPIPFWSTPIVPLLFLVSSLSTGVMAVDLILTLTGTTTPSISAALRVTDLVLLTVEALVIALYLGLSHATVAARGSTALLTRGDLAPRFWGGVALAGLAVPFVIQLAEVTSPAGALAPLAALSSLLGLLGGLMLRHVVVAAGAKAPLVAAGMAFMLPARAQLERG